MVSSVPLLKAVIILFRLNMPSIGHSSCVKHSPAAPFVMEGFPKKDKKQSQNCSVSGMGWVFLKQKMNLTLKDAPPLLPHAINRAFHPKNGILGKFLIISNIF